MKKTLLQMEEALLFIANQALEYDIDEQELLIVEKIVAKMTHIHYESDKYFSNLSVSNR